MRFGFYDRKRRALLISLSPPKDMLVSSWTIDMTWQSEKRSFWEGKGNMECSALRRPKAWERAREAEGRTRMPSWDTNQVYGGK
jgi:hypothetical protein